RAGDGCCRRVSAAGRAAVLRGPADEAGGATAATATAAATPDRHQAPLLVPAIVVGVLGDPATVCSGPLPHVEHLAAVPVAEADVVVVRVEHLELLVVTARHGPLAILGAVRGVPVPQVDRLTAVASDDAPPSGAGRLEAELLA